MFANQSIIFILVCSSKDVSLPLFILSLSLCEVDVCWSFITMGCECYDGSPELCGGGGGVIGSVWPPLWQRRMT